MPYKLYRTEGIVIGCKDIGEADRILSVFTKDFGKVEILAKGARLLKSKLRYHLNLFGWSHFSFISAKESWRLVDADQAHSWRGIVFSGDKMNICGRMANLIHRMVKGEELNANLWSLISNSFLFLDGKLNKRDFKEFETVFILRFLFELGYVAFDYKFLNSQERKSLIFLLNGGWHPHIFARARENQIALKRVIEYAFEESQL
jgi:DNA repair protein RecO (recombination protein O)